MKFEAIQIISLNLLLIFKWIIFHLINILNKFIYYFLYLPDNIYFIITLENIYIYKSNTESLSTPYTFPSEQQFKIVENSKMINCGKFKYNIKVQNLLVVKNYLYSFIDSSYKCYQAISEIENYIS